MAELPQAERYLLNQVLRGEQEGWTRLVQRYEGRLVAFARSRAGDDAEDLVQDTFIAFLQSLRAFRGDASLETYLFTILRRKIIDRFRGSRLDTCQLSGGENDSSGDWQQQLPGPELTASWYARRDERHDRQGEALAQALREVIEADKASGDFRHLQVVEMLFYCQLRNKDIARLAGIETGHVGLIKHRCLKAIGQRVAELIGPDAGELASDAYLTELWQSRRLSCPKRSTIGAYLLGTLESSWRQYVQFHLETLGCHFCRANLDDLRQQTAGPQRNQLQQRILQSTIGFLPHSS